MGPAVVVVGQVVAGGQGGGEGAAKSWTSGVSPAAAG
jgi:hypothetical protein